MIGLLKILFLEDVISDAELIWREIEKSQIAFEKLLVDNRKDFVEGIATFNPDIIIADYKLPDFDGISALNFRNENTPLIPFILVTGSINEEVAVECMKAGADDYVLKENLSRLGPAINNSLNKAKFLKQKLDAENALRESEERFRILYDEAVAGLYRTNLQGDILMANKTLIKMLGFQNFEELASRNLNVAGYAPSYKRNTFIDRIEKEGEVRNLEATWIRKDGKAILVKESAKAIRNSEGKIIFYDGIVEDITERKKVEEDLDISNRLIEGILNAIPARVFWKDINLVYLGCNAIFAKDAGLIEPREIIGKNDYQLVWREQADLYRNDDLDVIRSGKPKFNIEESQSTPDGNTITLLTNKVPLFTSNGKISGILGTYIDITYRKRAEEALSKSEARFRSYFNSSIVGISITSPTKGWIEVNEHLCDLLGYTREELLLTTWSELTHPEDLNLDYENFDRVVKGEIDGYNIDKRFICKNGEIIWTSLSVRCVRHSDGQVDYFIALLFDISERKRAEIELIHSKEKAEEGDRLKTAFLNNISHEIRTPLNAIVGFATILGRYELTPEKKKEFVDIIFASNNQLLSIISGILSLASLEAGQEKISEAETDLNKLLLNVYEQFSITHKSAEVEFNYQTSLPDTLAFVYTDPVKLMQILVNLVENAMKYTHKGEVSFGYTVSDNKLQFYVKDTGIGIPQDMKELIFERFRQVDNSPTRKYGGTGLGLSISKGYVELLGGSIMLSSELGKGSVFSFTLPYNPVTPVPSDEKNHLKDSGILIPPGKTILVAEDETNNFLLINEILVDMQLKVYRAVNGFEAVNFCSPGNLPDLILMDIKMPEMDGIEATKKIKGLYPQVPIIALTAYALEEDKRNILSSGCNEYIQKPLNRQLLFDTLAKYLAD